MEDDGLPPADWGILLHVLTEGRLAAVGSFGKHRRAWCAILSRNGDKTAVNVFHRATFVPPQDDKHWQENERNPQTVFEPSWMHVYQPRGEHEAPRLLIGRQKFPLLVNLQTLEVSNYSTEHWSKSIYLNNLHRSESYYSYDGKLLVAGNRSVSHYALDDSGLRFKCVKKSDTSGRYAGFFLSDGWLYYAGYRWSRFNPRTFEEQKLTNGDLPVGYGMTLAAPSSHYGIVALGGYGVAGGKVFRVNILEDDLPNNCEAKKQ